jgi:hypothetical protein
MTHDQQKHAHKTQQTSTNCFSKIQGEQHHLHHAASLTPPSHEKI